MSTDSRGALRSLAVYSASTAALTALVYVTYRTSPAWQYDLQVYKSGVDQIFNHTSLYNNEIGFTYPPFGALLLFFLHFLSMRASTLALMVASIALTHFAVTRYAGKISSWLTVGATAAFVWLFPGRISLTLGQVTFIILAITALDLTAEDSRKLKGIGIGIMAGLKLLPGIFILYFLITRRWRAAMMSCASFAASIAVGFALLPHDSYDYWTSVAFDSGRIGSPQDISSESIESMMVRWSRSTSWVDIPYAITALIVLVGGLWLAKKCFDRHEELLAIATCGIVIVLVLPIAWTFYWEWVLVPLLIRLCQLAVKQKEPLVIAFLAVLVVEFSLNPSEHAQSTMSGKELTLPISQQLLSSTHAIAALVALSGIAVLMIRNNPNPTSTTEGPGLDSLQACEGK